MIECWKILRTDVWQRLLPGVPKTRFAWPTCHAGCEMRKERLAWLTKISVGAGECLL